MAHHIPSGLLAFCRLMVPADVTPCSCARSPTLPCTITGHACDTTALQLAPMLRRHLAAVMWRPEYGAAAQLDPSLLTGPSILVSCTVLGYARLLPLRCAPTSVWGRIEWPPFGVPLRLPLLWVARANPLLCPQHDIKLCAATRLLCPECDSKPLHLLCWLANPV